MTRARHHEGREDDVRRIGVQVGGSRGLGRGIIWWTVHALDLSVSFLLLRMYEDTFWEAFKSGGIGCDAVEWVLLQSFTQIAYKPVVL